MFVLKIKQKNIESYNSDPYSNSQAHMLITIFNLSFIRSMIL